MVIDGRRQWQQDGTHAGGREFRHRQGAGAADHEVGRRILARHVVDELAHLGRHTGRAIGCTHGSDPLVATPGLMEYLRAAGFRQSTQRRRQQPVQRCGPLTATEHEQTRRTDAVREAGGRRRQGRDFLANRVAGHQRAAVAEGGGERRQHAPRQVCQRPIGESGHGVLLVDDQRHARQSRGHAAGSGNEPTQAEHQGWPTRAQRSECLQDGATKPIGCRQPPLPALATQTPDVQPVDRDASRRHQTRFNALTGPEPADRTAPLLQLAGHRQRREHVAAGTAGHHDDMQGRRAVHAAPPAVPVADVGATPSGPRPTVRCTPQTS